MSILHKKKERDKFIKVNCYDLRKYFFFLLNIHRVMYLTYFFTTTRQQIVESLYMHVYFFFARKFFIKFFLLSLDKINFNFGRFL